MPMPSEYNADLFATFNDLQLAGGTVQCIAHITNKSRRRCNRRRRIDITKCNRRSILIAENFSISENERKGRAYISSRLCGIHNKRLAGSMTLEQVAQRWNVEARTAEAISDHRTRNEEAPEPCVNDTIRHMLGETGADGRYSLRRRTTRRPTLTFPTSASMQANSRAFLQYSRPSTNRTGMIFKCSLKPAVRKNGFVYILTRSDDPTFLKIGYTKRSPEERCAEWNKCDPKLIVRHTVADVPYPRRAESLIQSDPRLREYRRYNTSCLNNPICRKLHKEWFEISIETGIAVVNEWTSFFKQEELYDADGLLTGVWKDRADSIIGDVTLEKLRAVCKESLAEAATHADVTPTPSESDQIRYPTLPPLHDTSLDYDLISRAATLRHDESVDLEVRWRRFTSTGSTPAAGPREPSRLITADLNAVSANKESYETSIATNDSDCSLLSASQWSSRNLQWLGHALMIVFSVEATAQGVSFIHRIMLAVSLFLLSSWSSCVEL